MKKCKTCEEIEFWNYQPLILFKQKIFAEFAIYKWRKKQKAIKGKEQSIITTKSFDLNYCPTCGKKINKVEIEKE